jgi:triosephosphate isomerase
MRRPVIAGNWKMFKTASEAVDLIANIKAGVHKLNEEIDIVVCPPFTSLAAVGPLLAGTQIGLGAQNMYPESEGPFTGEISPPMLKDLGCRYVILGHSERRSHFHESDEVVNEKVRTAIKYNLIPIVCIGEWLQEREAGKHFEVVRAQFHGTFDNLSADEMEKVVIAYEPVWAIGTGKTATPGEAEEMHQFIRELLKEKYGVLAAKTRILYGGSVKPDNITELMAQPDVDGALVGGASLKGESFVEIIHGAVQEGVK